MFYSYPLRRVALQFRSSSPPGHCGTPSHLAPRETQGEPGPPHRNACIGQRSPVPSTNGTEMVNVLKNGIKFR